MEVPTEATRERITRDWLLLGGLAIIPAGLLIWLAWPISAWVVRPLERLQQSMDRMRRGELSVRADTETGPPELQGVARAFNSMADTVVSTLERQQQFVADASHQLRNPLASMHIAVENLEPHLMADGESREAFDETLDTVQRMEHIVAGMLAATRLEHASRAPDRAQLVTVPPASVAGWQAHAEHAGGRLRVDMEPAAVPEPAGGLESLVDELIDNAFRLGGARTVVVRGRRLPGDGAAHAAGAGYLIEVADDGQGLPPDELAQAGTRFWRSPRNQNTPGTGLGLSIVRQAVEDVGGSLELRAAPGGGLIASLRLPLAPDGSGPPRHASDGPGASDGSAAAPDEA
nr:HAMP domain-containing sensor histidine kinase [Sediminivirga luteola]